MLGLVIKIKIESNLKPAAADTMEKNQISCGGKHNLYFGGVHGLDDINFFYKKSQKFRSEEFS